MPRGEKSGNPRMKRHRAAGIAERMRRQGAPRAESYRIANARMEREYARVGARDPEKMAVNEDTHDSRSGQRKTNLTTKRPAISGARQPSIAQHPASSKRSAKETGGGGKASAGRKPRVSSDPATHASARKSATAIRKPPPWRAAGYRVPGTRRKSKAARSKMVKTVSSKRTPRSVGPGGVGTARKPPMVGRTSPAKKASGVSRTS
jgi:hypothetical protein